MEVILLVKVENLGEPGDVVRVKPGYARNYLIPYGKAKAATRESIAEFERRKAELEELAAAELAQAEERKRKIDGLTLTVTVKVTEEGAMFGSVGTTEVMEAVQNACGERIQRSEVRLPNGVFHEVGEYGVALSLHPNVVASVQLNIVAEE